MEILVVGLGSMGKRRIRLIKQLFNNVKITGVDLDKVRREDATEQFEIIAIESLQSALQKSEYTAVFVCSAPLTHSDIIENCLQHKINVFSEINLTDDNYDKLILLADKKKCKLFLSSTPMYRNEIRYITEKIQSQAKLLSYVYHVGQYLPDWHPWENYEDFFVNDKRTNGCREIFAIELGWIMNAFGNITSVSTVKSKNSTLNIDYYDSYIVTFIHATGHRGVMIVDVVSRMAVRKLEVIGEDLHLFWEGTPESLRDYDIALKQVKPINTYEQIDYDVRYCSNIIENAYVEEIKEFFLYIADESIPKYSFQKDKEILRIIDIIEG
ncbi:Gfo/Idh/MocA family protein [Desulfosporosinus nitroreducens]|uniref:Gfo/Idh/MocA family protein n=1 Tax=Desulfosporosinus nitroreducens TaxID=2018668 RepID=UPI00207D380C|nr:Gfo/Idh/MocA family oxidoreductase [Desulfosporosinus nitroreducens]MCO1601325.1 Gfo/Idh/MocA family oxidoreductase [Desulfosporosinus nitroreducens]